jgi:PAS domain S-box-containing protein
MPVNNAAGEKAVLDPADLYENAPFGYHSVDLRGTILRMNSTELRWLGFAQQELVRRRKFIDLVPARFRGEYKNSLAALIAGAEVSELETKLVCKNGAAFDARLRIAAERDKRGLFLCTRATVIDTSAGKRAATAARMHAEQLRAMWQHIADIRQIERRSLSAALHDRLGPDLAAIALNLHIIKEQLAANSCAGVGPRLADSIALVEHSVAAVRDVAGALRLPAVDDCGLAATLRNYCERFADRTGIRVAVAAKCPAPRLHRNAEMALFLISQEALTNIMKHAGASAVCVTLAAEAKHTVLTIADNGCGFDAKSRTGSATRKLGLLIMQERLRALAGSLRIESRPGAGTRVTAKIKESE